MEVLFKDVGFEYVPGVPVIRDVNLCLTGNKLVSIIGPNGVGKSTLIHCMNKILKPTWGEVFINGKNVDEYSLKEMAKVIGYVPCTSSDAFPLSVVDTVLLGRSPHSKWNSLNDDLIKVHGVLELLEIGHLAMRQFNELSAGQHQKVMLARGLVQESQILILDEPTANLDVKHQMGVTRLLRDYAHKKGILVIMISHDLNIASKYSDQIVVMHEGGIFASGPPSEVMIPETVEAVYGVRSKVITNRGRPHIILEDEQDEVNHASCPQIGDQVCQTALT